MLSNKVSKVSYILVFVMIFCSLIVAAKDIPVDNTDPGCSGLGHPLCTIQEAIDHPLTAPGDTINVTAGTYAEDLIISKDNLEIAGSDKTTTFIKGTQTKWVNRSVTQNKVNGTLCDDGLFCTDNDQYIEGNCTGVQLDCSANDLPSIGTCDYDPDNYSFTWDSFPGFISECNEAIDQCSTGTITITSLCNTQNCSAECEADADCLSNSCQETYNDFCQNQTLVEYNNNSVLDNTTIFDLCANNCTDCLCANCTTDCSPPPTNTYCVKDVCNAECDIHAHCIDKCIDDVFYTNGTCSNSGCVCNYDAINCSNMTKWYSTGNIQWVNLTNCVLRKQIEKEYRLYTCAIDGCNYTVTQTKWVNRSKFQNMTNGTLCNDGFFCTVNDQCTEGNCNGTERNCSADNILVNECSYNPDGNDFTTDYYSFTSVCNDTLDLCTIAPIAWENDITHTCNRTDCNAECRWNGQCADTVCTNEGDGCYDGIWRYYGLGNVSNNCLDNCSCEINSCVNYTVETTDVDEDGYTFSCDCDDADSGVNPGATEICSNGKDDDCDGSIDNRPSPTSVILLPSESSWQGDDFTVSVDDMPINATLVLCEYKVRTINRSDRTHWFTTVQWTVRDCNSDITIDVGPYADCQAQGFETCEVRVKATDDGSCTSNVTSRFFSIDERGPTIKAETPEHGSYTNDATPEISALITDRGRAGINYSSAKISVDGADVTAYALILDKSIIYIPTINLSEGTHIVSINLSDVLSNRASKEWSFIVDTIVPIVNVSSPEGKGYEDDRITITAEANEKVRYLNGERNNREFTLCTNCFGDTKKLEFKEDQHTLIIKAIDYAGNIGYSQVDFFVDSTPPRIIKTDPKDGAILYGTDFGVKYKEDNLDKVTLYWKESTQNNYTSHELSGCYSGNNRYCSADLDLEIYDGKNINYYLGVSDSISTTTSDPKTILIDNTGPVVTISSPITGSVNPEKRLFVAVGVDEEVDLLEYSMDDNIDRYRKLCSDCDSYDKKKIFKDGDHILRVKATDYAGNIGESSIGFSVDSKAPKIHRQYPRNNGHANGTFTLEYSEDNLNNISLYYKRLLATEYIEVPVPDCEPGSRQSCTITIDISADEGQLINYYFKARDFVNEATSKVYKEWVDSTPPIMTVALPQNTTYAKKVPIDISISEEVNVLEYADNDDNFKRLCSKCDEYQKSKTFTKGAHVIVFRATDYSGNRAYATRQVNVVGSLFD